MSEIKNKYFIGNIIFDLGFDSLEDFLTTIIGFKNNIITPIAFFIGTSLSFFIKENFWSNPSEVYFLAILIAIDLFTGIWKSIKFKNDAEKKFKSRKINRTVGKIITYSIILYITFNLNKNMPIVFFWAPHSCLLVFYATEAWSIIENLSEIGYLDKNLVIFLKKKLNIKNLLKNNLYDENNVDNKDTDKK